MFNNLFFYNEFNIMESFNNNNNGTLEINIKNKYIKLFNVDNGKHKLWIFIDLNKFKNKISNPDILTQQYMVPYIDYRGRQTYSYSKPMSSYVTKKWLLSLDLMFDIININNVVSNVLNKCNIQYSSISESNENFDTSEDNEQIFKGLLKKEDYKQFIPNNYSLSFPTIFNKYLSQDFPQGWPCSSINFVSNLQDTIYICVQ